MTDFGNDLMVSMQEALAHSQGKTSDAHDHYIDILAVDVKAIRKKLKLTQEQIALMLGVSVSGYRKWEQGERTPNGAAKTLLRVMDKEPQAVLRAIS